SVNMSKSSVFFSRKTPVHLKNIICASMPGITCHRSTRYLGLPLGIGRSKLDTFQYILDSVLGRLQSWRSKLLSQAGKAVLIKAVLQALP
ncbi:Unknown protein, partial [Striga hermonthica]